MAEITSGNVTVLVLSYAETEALVSVLRDWVDESFSRAFDFGDDDVISAYKGAASVLREVFDALDVRVEE